MNRRIEDEIQELQFQKANGDLAYYIPKRFNEVRRHFSPLHIKCYDKDNLEAIREEQIRSGWLLAAWEYLLASTRAFLDKPYRMKYDRRSLMWKYIFEDDYSSALEVSESIKKRMTKKHLYYDQFSVFEYTVLGGNYCPTRVFEENPYYVQLLNNKRLAVIGPAFDEEIVPQHISNEYDVVVLLNQKNSKKLNEFKKHNDVKVVLYYNYERFMKIIKSNECNALFNSFDGVITKFYAERVSNNDRRIRNMLLPQAFEQFGAYNMIQDILFDLLQFRPKEIKVFGTNMFISESEKALYNPDYWQTTKGNDKLKDSFIYHKPDINYYFTLLLYKKKRFVGDKLMQRVMDLGIRRYLSSIEDLFY